MVNLETTVIQEAIEWWSALPLWLGVFIVIGTSVAVGFAFERIVVRSLQVVARRSAWEYDDAVIKSLSPGLGVLVVWALASAAFRFLDIQFRPGASEIFLNLGITLVVIAIAYSLTRLMRGVLRVRAKQSPSWQRLSASGSRVAAIVVYLVAFVLIIGQYGIEITPLLTTMGLAGLAVALALQDTLANFFSGLWIQAQPSLQTGHYVRFEEAKLEGFVEDIGWRTTKIRTLPGNIIEVPNQKIAQSTVQDFWLPDPKMGTSITIVTGFEADPERVVPMMLEECMAAADEVSFILREPAPAARLNKAVENGWEYWMSIWVPYYYNQWNAQGYVLNKIRKRFLKEGIRMPYPIRETVQVAPDRVDVSGSIASARPSDGSGSGVRAAVAEARRKDAGPGTVEPTK
jgi:small-conductance mechanosensitive channel